MYLHLLFICLASVCWVSADEESCNTTEYYAAYATLYKELGLLDSSNAMNHMRPLIYKNDPTYVLLELYLTSITDVDENAQTISTQIILATVWIKDAEVLWIPNNFCNINSITIQKDFFWNPDLAIMESIKTEFASESSYVQLFFVEKYYYFLKIDILSLTTVCSMDLYRFPFDTQICTLTFQSLAHSGDVILDSLNIMLFKQPKQIPGEWILLNMTRHITQGIPSKTIYQIAIKRRPLLYIINFIFPVFCFLVLDVASFFINASTGDKLSFKVTLLLSLSVLLQILNDRLATTVSEIPLIGIYCCSIFILIGLSILETILVNILIVKEDTESAISMETTDVVNVQDDGVSDLHKPIDTVTCRNEDSTCTRESGKKALLCWTKAAKIIDVIFIVLYIITVIVLLSVLGKHWFLV